jgi:hypothetical protein
MKNNAAIAMPFPTPDPRVVAIPIPICMGDVADIAVISKYGTFDWGIPLSWSKENPDTRAVWLYTDRCRIFGRPLTHLAILRLARRKCKDDYDLERIEAAIATFKPHTLTAQNIIHPLNA